MSDYDTSAISLDIEDIIKSGPKNVTKDLLCTLHTKEEDIQITRILSYECQADYANFVGDIIDVRFWMPLGDYINRLYPYRTNLEFTIRRTTLTSTGSSREKNVPIVSSRYKAIFDINVNQPVAGADVEAIDTFTLNNATMVTVTLRLVNRSLEPLRVKQASGAFNATKIERVLQAVMMGESLKVLIDGKPSLDGVDIVPPDNTDIIPTIVIPGNPMKKLSSIPTFLQEQGPGVYNGGIGTYFTTYQGKRMWFVYPIFDPSRFDKEKGAKLVIYAAPSWKYPSIDRTYEVSGDLVRIIATGEKQYKDGVDIEQMNDGSGFRVQDARSIMRTPVQFDKDGNVLGARARTAHEINYGDREDGLNYAPSGAGGPTSNPFKYRSNVMKRNMGQIDVIWENGDASLLYPGMPVCYTSLNQGKPVKVKGTLVFCHELTGPKEQNSSTGYYTKIHLSILTETRSDTPKVSTYTNTGGYSV